MGDLVDNEKFKEAQRKKKYGDPVKKLKGLGLPDDYSPFEPEPEEPYCMAWVQKILDRKGEE